MVGNVFRQSFEAISSSAIALSKAFEGLKHQGVKGQLREMLLTQLFEPFLPPDVRVASGNIVSADGAQSPQIDAIVYSPSIMPAFLLEKTGLVPIEACLYSIEVKSRLNAAELKKSIKNAKALASMPMLKARFFQREPTRIAEVELDMFGPIRVIIAFDSDLKGPPENEIKRYRKYDPLAAALPAIGVLCIVGRGYWYAHADGSWTRISAKNEALGFLAGMTNTIPQLIAGKGKPKFGNYLL